MAYAAAGSGAYAAVGSAAATWGQASRTLRYRGDQPDAAFKRRFEILCERARHSPSDPRMTRPYQGKGFGAGRPSARASESK